MRESEIEKILVQEVAAAGGRAYKFVSPGNDGVPDRIVVLPKGRVYFVELKTDTGDVTKLQGVQMVRLVGMGCDARLVRGLAGLKQFFLHAGMIDAAKRVERKLK